MHPEPNWPTGRYVLKHEAYIARMPGFDHELLPSGTEIVYSGKPGPHMEPVDEGAQEACRMAGTDQMNLDPFGNVPMTSAASDEDIMAERVAAAVASAFAKLGLVPTVAAQQAQEPEPPPVTTMSAPEPNVPGLETLIPPPLPPPLPPPPPPLPPPAPSRPQPKQK